MDINSAQGLASIEILQWSQGKHYQALEEIVRRVTEAAYQRGFDAARKSEYVCSRCKRDVPENAPCPYCAEWQKGFDAALEQAAQPELLEPILWDYWFDDMKGRWPEMVRVMETNPLWANGKHNGDCTRVPMTCQRCLVERHKEESAQVAAALGGVPCGARQGAGT